MHHQCLDARKCKLNCIPEKESHLINMAIQDNLVANCSLASHPSTNFITATFRQLRYLWSRHTSSAQTQAVSLAPSLTKKQAKHLNIANSSRSPNIGIFGLVALQINSGDYSKVFANTRAPIPVPSSRNQMSQRDARIRMTILSATTILRRMNHTGLGSL